MKGAKTKDFAHKIKDETFYLQEGKLKVLYGYDEDIEKSESIVLEKGDSFHIPVGMIHRMIAIEDSYLFEFSTDSASWKNFSSINLLICLNSFFCENEKLKNKTATYI